MPDVLVRGLSEEAVQRIEQAAVAAGLSRNEYLRRTLNQAPAPDRRPLTLADLDRSAAAAADLMNESVMAAAWR